MEEGTSSKKPKHLLSRTSGALNLRQKTLPYIAKIKQKIRDLKKHYVKDQSFQAYIGLVLLTKWVLLGHLETKPKENKRKGLETQNMRRSK